MSKIRCKMCANSNGKKCIIKNEKVSQNKPRRCESFVEDSEKFKPRQVLKAKYVPFYMDSKKEYRKVKAEKEKQAALASVKKDVSPDCLANFRSTANTEDNA